MLGYCFFGDIMGSYMRSFIILLKKIGLQKIVAILIAVVLIGIAFTYLAKTPKDSTKEYQTLVDQTKYQVLIPKLEKIIAENPDDINSRELLAAAYIQKAESEPNTSREDLLKSLSLLTKNTYLDKNRDESFRLLGVANFYLNDIVTAERNFAKATSINPSNLDAQAGLGMIYEKRNESAKVFGLYNNILKKNSGHEMANLGIARYYMSIGDANKAVQHAKDVLSSSKNNSSLGEANHILGTAMMTYNRPVEALLYFRDSVKYRPENVHSWVMLGEANVEAYKIAPKFERANYIQGATEAGTKALSLNPKYIYAHTLLYKVNLLQNKYEEANAIAKTIVGLLPRDTQLGKEEKAQYLKYYSGEITNVKIKSIKASELIKN
jgi:cytochrome c-type biogenesis protein CcmH/NrfG